jgi:hypothetical protein
MSEFFKKSWDIEIERFNLFLEYWYVWLILFIIMGVTLYYFNNKKY